MSEPTPSVPVVRLPSRRMVAGVVLALAGVLTVVGSFLGLFQLTAVVYQLRGGPVTEDFVTTSWTSVYPTYGLTLGSASRGNYYGVAAIVAAALALYAASLLLRGHDPLRLGRIRLFAMAATCLVAGYVWATITTLIDNMAQNDDPATFTYSVGPGLWLLIAATLVGALGSVLLHGLAPVAPSPEPNPAADEVVVYQVDVDTPPLGFEVPVNLPPADTYQPPAKP